MDIIMVIMDIHHGNHGVIMDNHGHPLFLFPLFLLFCFSHSPGCFPLEFVPEKSQEKSPQVAFVSWRIKLGDLKYTKDLAVN